MLSLGAVEGHKTGAMAWWHRPLTSGAVRRFQDLATHR
jgi:hypothetical protein